MLCQLVNYNIFCTNVEILFNLYHTLCIKCFWQNGRDASKDDMSLEEKMDVAEETIGEMTEVYLKLQEEIQEKKRELSSLNQKIAKAMRNEIEAVNSLKQFGSGERNHKRYGHSVMMACVYQREGKMLKEEQKILKGKIDELMKVSHVKGEQIGNLTSEWTVLVEQSVSEVKNETGGVQKAFQFSCNGLKTVRVNGFKSEKSETCCVQGTKKVVNGVSELKGTANGQQVGKSKSCMIDDGKRKCVPVKKWSVARGHSSGACRFPAKENVNMALNGGKDGNQTKERENGGGDWRKNGGNASCESLSDSNQKDVVSKEKVSMSGKHEQTTNKSAEGKCPVEEFLDEDDSFLLDIDLEGIEQEKCEKVKDMKECAVSEEIEWDGDDDIFLTIDC